MFVQLLQQAAAEFGIPLTDKQLAHYDSYFQLLLVWNEKVNLTAITEPQEVAVKHMIDSLSCYDERYFPTGASVIDVGTGAGFPGLPLKIFRPDLELTLLDSLQKRLAFLQEVVVALELPDIELLHSRAEDAGRGGQREQYDVALSRAVARLNILCELCLPFVKVGGYFIALKGAQYNQEAAESKQALQVLGAEIAEIRPVTLPGLDDVRAVLYIKKVKPTPAAYPRRAGTPEKKPL